MSEQTHPLVFTDADFANLAYILGAYVGVIIQRNKEGKASQVEVSNAIHRVAGLREKLDALRETM